MTQMAKAPAIKPENQGQALGLPGWKERTSSYQCPLTTNAHTVTHVACGYLILIFANLTFFHRIYSSWNSNMDIFSYFAHSIQTSLYPSCSLAISEGLGAYP